MSFWMSLFRAHRHSRFTFSSLLFLSLVFFFGGITRKNMRNCHPILFEKCFFLLPPLLVPVYSLHWPMSHLTFFFSLMIFLSAMFFSHLTANSIEVSPRVCKQRRNKDQEPRHTNSKKWKWDKFITSRRKCCPKLHENPRRIIYSDIYIFFSLVDRRAVK